MEMVLPGDTAMEEWAIQGRVSSSRWTKHRGGVVEEGVWLDMIQGLKQRQRAAVEGLQADRRERKRERAEQAAAA